MTLINMSLFLRKSAVNKLLCQIHLNFYPQAQCSAPWSRWDRLWEHHITIKERTGLLSGFHIICCHHYIIIKFSPPQVV